MSRLKILNNIPVRAADAADNEDVVFVVFDDGGVGVEETQETLAAVGAEMYKMSLSIFH